MLRETGLMGAYRVRQLTSVGKIIDKNDLFQDLSRGSIQHALGGTQQCGESLVMIDDDHRSRWER